MGFYNDNSQLFFIIKSWNQLAAANNDRSCFPITKKGYWWFDCWSTAFDHRFMILLNRTICRSISTHDPSLHTLFYTSLYSQIPQNELVIRKHFAIGGTPCSSKDWCLKRSLLISLDQLTNCFRCFLCSLALHNYNCSLLSYPSIWPSITRSSLFLLIIC